jgi:hypothetical protein
LFDVSRSDDKHAATTITLGLMLSQAYGASPPCHNPRDAEIIIVSTNSASGRRFIRDWGNDPSKVVLGVAWVQDCIKQGKPLLLADGWGGHVAEDDGLPIPDGDADLDQTAEETVYVSLSMLAHVYHMFKSQAPAYTQANPERKHSQDACQPFNAGYARKAQTKTLAQY